MLPRLLAPDRPDWRWARVADLSQFSNTQATARLRSEDEATRRAYMFRRALDRGTPDDFPDLHAAHHVFHTRPHARFFLEGMLLAGADNERIASVSADVDAVSVVQAYHDLFFAVRPYLKKPAWVVASVFQGPVYRTHAMDRSGIMLRVAWILGPQAFETMVCRGNATELDRNQIRTMVETILHSQLAEVAFSAATRQDLPDWITAFLAKVDDAKAPGSSDAEVSGHVVSFLDGLALSVADPTDTRNLNLPAREARAIAIPEVATNA
jgi:hypothetical protein